MRRTPEDGGGAAPSVEGAGEEHRPGRRANGDVFRAVDRVLDLTAHDERVGHVQRTADLAGAGGNRLRPDPAGVEAFDLSGGCRAFGAVDAAEALARQQLAVAEWLDGEPGKIYAIQQ